MFAPTEGARGGSYTRKSASAALNKFLSEVRQCQRILSEREEQALQLAASGKSNRLIALELNLSVRMVEPHRYHLMHKLSLKDKAKVVDYARQQGMLPDSLTTDED